jgi:hypothetical protein
MIATDGDEATITTWLEATLETHERGTATTLDQVLGTLTVAGVTTKLETAT